MKLMRVLFPLLMSLFFAPSMAFDVLQITEAKRKSSFIVTEKDLGLIVDANSSSKDLFYFSSPQDNCIIYDQDNKEVYNFESYYNPASLIYNAKKETIIFSVFDPIVSEDTTRFFSFDKNKNLLKILHYPYKKPHTIYLTLSDDGNYLVAYMPYKEAPLTLFKLENNYELVNFGEHKLNQLAINSDGSMIVFTKENIESSDHKIYVYNTSNPTSKPQELIFNMPINCFKFNPKNPQELVMVSDKIIKIYQMNNKKDEEISVDYSIYSFAFTPDGKTIALGHENGSVTLMDLFSKKAQVVEDKTLTTWVTSIRFNETGDLMQTFTDLNQVIFWKKRANTSNTANPYCHLF